MGRGFVLSFRWQNSRGYGYRDLDQLCSAGVLPFLARNALKPEGLVGVLDWTKPDAAALRWGLYGLLTVVEPRSALDWIESDCDSYLRQADLVCIESHTLARGVTKVVIIKIHTCNNYGTSTRKVDTESFCSTAN